MAWLTSLAVAVAAIAWLAFGRRGEASRPATVAAGRNVFAGVEPASHASSLAAMEWADVMPTIEAVSPDHGTLDRVIRLCESQSHAPAVYLGALLQMARGEHELALRRFSTIDPSEIPTDHLYAPHRLNGVLRAGQASPYLPFLRQAMAENRLSPLIEARVRVESGEFREALEAYLRSDPARWVELDAVNLGALLRHAGVATEAARVLGGALHAGRVPSEVRTNLLMALKAASDDSTAVGSAPDLADYLRRNPVIQAAAVRAVTNQLEVRKTFVGRRYRDLLNQHRAVQPLALPDETILLLVLAAARDADHAAFELWSQEMKRRNPSTKVSAWIRQIKADIR